MSYQGTNFNQWWQQNKPDDFFGRGRRRRAMEANGGVENVGDFKQYQQDTSQKNYLRGLYRAGQSSDEILAAMQNMPKGLGQAGNWEAQNQWFNNTPGSYDAYLQQNNLVNTAGANAGPGAGRVYNANDPNVYFDAAGNPHSGIPPGMQPAINFGPGGYQPPMTITDPTRVGGTGTTPPTGPNPRTWASNTPTTGVSGRGSTAPPPVVPFNGGSQGTPNQSSPYSNSGGKKGRRKPPPYTPPMPQPNPHTVPSNRRY